MFERILVPLDGSAFAESALSLARDLAQQLGSELIVITVVKPAHLELGDDASHEDLVERVRQTAFQQQTAYLNNKVHELQTQGLAIRGQVLDASDIAAAILNVASVEAVDLIVMTTHGRSGMSRWALGSVTERVLRQAICPVLAVRDNQENQGLLQ